MKRRNPFIIHVGDTIPRWYWKGHVPKSRIGSSLIHLTNGEPYANALCGMGGLGDAIDGNDPDKPAEWRKRICGECARIAMASNA